MCPRGCLTYYTTARRLRSTASGNVMAATHMDRRPHALRVVHLLAVRAARRNCAVYVYMCACLHPPPILSLLSFFFLHYVCWLHKAIKASHKAWDSPAAGQPCCQHTCSHSPSGLLMALARRVCVQVPLLLLLPPRPQCMRAGRGWRHVWSLAATQTGGRWGVGVITAVISC